MGPSLWFRTKVKWNRLRRNHFFNYGLPFFVFMVGASFVLTEFTSIRYEVVSFKQRSLRSVRTKETPEESEEGEERFNVEALGEEIQSGLKEDYENIRGPREYEDNTEAMELLRKKIEEVQKSKQGILVQALDLVLNPK